MGRRLATIAPMVAGSCGPALPAKGRDSMKLSDRERRRYHRQMMLAGWGEETQEKL
jgi:hypothetical protein